MEAKVRNPYKENLRRCKQLYDICLELNQENEHLRDKLQEFGEDSL